MGLLPEDRRHDRRQVEVACSRFGRLVQPGSGGVRQLHIPTRTDRRLGSHPTPSVTPRPNV